jgi:hypothetical protein
MSFTDLPVEVNLHIFDYLDLYDIINVQLLSRIFHDEIFKREMYWINIYNSKIVEPISKFRLDSNYLREINTRIQHSTYYEGRIISVTAYDYFKRQYIMRRAFHSLISYGKETPHPNIPSFRHVENKHQSRGYYKFIGDMEFNTITPSVSEIIIHGWEDCQSDVCPLIPWLGAQPQEPEELEELEEQEEQEEQEQPEQPEELEELEETTNAKYLGLDQSVYSFTVGDMGYDTCEISWIRNGNVTPVFTNLSNLVCYKSQGCGNMSMDITYHPKLSKICIISSNLSGSFVSSLLESEFPALIHLELWLGTRDYGRSCDARDLAKLLATKEEIETNGLEVFPSLEHLGIINTQNTDEICPMIAASALLRRLRVLHLEHGELTANGVKHLVDVLVPNDQFDKTEFPYFEKLNIGPLDVSNHPDVEQKLTILSAAVCVLTQPCHELRYLLVTE